MDQPPGGEAVPPPVGDELGDDDGGGECGGFDLVGITVGVIDTDGVVEGDGLFVLVYDGLGAALIALPTCAAGGKFSTGAPCSAAFIICCQVSAGSPPP
jgi:hypothetical protein